jgi:hypothetical protein
MIRLDTINLSISSHKQERYVMRVRFNGLLALALALVGMLFVACGGSNTPPGWQNVGNGVVAANAAISGRIAVVNGTPYAAYVDEMTGILTVAKFDGSNWVTLGSTGFTVVDQYSFSLYVDGTTPYVAATDSSDNLTLLAYNGSSWGQIGAQLTVYSDAPGTLLISNGIAYVATVYGGAAHVVKSSVGAGSGTSWTDLALPDATYYPYGVTNIGLTIFNNMPYVMIGDSTGVTLLSYSGGSWSVVATSAVGIDLDNLYGWCSSYPATLWVSNGTLYVSYLNSTNQYGAVFLKLTGSSLISIGELGSASPWGSSGVECVSGAVYNGTPYVAYDDENRDGDATPEAATVKYYDGSAWVLYAGYPSPNDIESTQLTVDQSNGHLYLTYEDDNLGGMTVQVH